MSSISKILSGCLYNYKKYIKFGESVLEISLPLLGFKVEFG
jgi:hypothetical protein